MMTSSAIQLISTFDCGPIEAPLRRAVNEVGISESIRVAPPAQLNAYMLTPSIESEDVIGTVVLVRLEDWLRETVPFLGQGSDPAARQELRKHLDEFLRHCSILALRGRPVWLLVCPSSGWIAEEYKIATLCRTMTNLFSARVRNLPQVKLLDCPAELSKAECYDRQLDRASHIPFTPQAFAYLALSIASQLARILTTQDSSAGMAASPGSPELAAFLAGLGVQVEATPAKSSDRADIDRILRTAASFSLAGEKPTIAEAEVDAILASHDCRLINVSDRLSNYGPSGVLAARLTDDSLVVDSLSLSCTVLGKQVEFALLSALSQIARERHRERVVFEFRASARNQPTLAFLRSVADAETDQRFVFAVDEAVARIAHAAVAPGAWKVRVTAMELEG